MPENFPALKRRAEYSVESWNNSLWANISILKVCVCVWVRICSVRYVCALIKIREKAKEAVSIDYQQLSGRWSCQ